MLPSYTRNGAAECYWLETSAGAGRPVPRAYAIGILQLARRHGFRRGPLVPNVYELWDRLNGCIHYSHDDGRELWLRTYTGNAW